MKRILINGTHHNEIRVAHVDDNRVSEFAIESNQQQFIQGNIYLGVVSSVKTDLESAFIDIGLERHGLLTLEDESEYSEEEDPPQHKHFKSSLKVGEKILVQVTREPRRDKGPALTSEVSIPGRFVVVKPNSQARAVSRSLTDEQREALRELGESLTTEKDIGWILRTSAHNRTVEEIKADFHRGLNLWRRIEHASNENRDKAPVLLYSDNTLMQRILRDRLRPDGTSVFIDDPRLCREAQEFAQDFMPELVEQIQLYRGKQELFRSFRVDKQIQSAFEREVVLRSGGTLVFDPTEALLSIDVNSSKNTRATNLDDTALNTNLQAAREIARQLILRNVGGLVVIDFIDMYNEEHRTRVEKEMISWLKRDPARTVCSTISEFGLMEMSRQRRRSSIYDTHFEECTHCHGARFLPTVETRVNQFLRDLSYQVLDTRRQQNQFICRLPEDVAVYILNKERVFLRSLETKTQKQVVIIPDPTLEDSDVEINSRHVSKLDYENGSNLEEVVEIESRTSKNRQRPPIPEAAEDSPQPLVKPLERAPSSKGKSKKAPVENKSSKKKQKSPQKKAKVEAKTGLGGWLKSLFSESSQPQQGKGSSKQKSKDKSKSKTRDTKQNTRSKSRGQGQKDNTRERTSQRATSTRREDPQQKKTDRPSDNRQRGRSGSQTNREAAPQQRGRTRTQQPRSGKSPTQADTKRTPTESRESKPRREQPQGNQRQSEEKIQSSRRMPPSDRAIGRSRQRRRTDGDSGQSILESAEVKSSADIPSSREANSGRRSSRRSSPRREEVVSTEAQVTTAKVTTQEPKQDADSRARSSSLPTEGSVKPSTQSVPKPTSLASNDPRRKNSGTNQSPNRAYKSETMQPVANADPIVQAQPDVSKTVVEEQPQTQEKPLTVTESKPVKPSQNSDAPSSRIDKEPPSPTPIVQEEDSRSSAESKPEKASSQVLAEEKTEEASPGRPGNDPRLARKS